MHLGLLLCQGTVTFLAFGLHVGWNKGLQAALGGGAHHVDGEARALLVIRQSQLRKTRLTEL